MTTYTIAYTVPEPGGVSLLLATVPDGEDVAAAIDRELGMMGGDKSVMHTVQTQTGLTLTDEEPHEDEGAVVWRGHEAGWLIDENGRTFQFAVRMDAA